jgi:hypothetical protein
VAWGDEIGGDFFSKGSGEKSSSFDTNRKKLA